MSVLALNSRPTPEGKFYTRAQFARLVGVSPWTLRHYAADGYFCPFAQGSKGRGYAAMYHESQVAQFRNLPPRTEPHSHKYKSLFTAQQAQACFKAFDEGKSARFCVTEVGVHPQALQAIMQEYASLDQGLFIPAAMLERINACTSLEGEFPVRTALDVVELIELADKNHERLEEVVTQQISCPSCKSGQATYCKGCVSETTRAFYDQGCKETLDKVRNEMAAMASSEPQKAEGAPAEAETPPVAPEAERQGPKKTRKRA